MTSLVYLVAAYAVVAVGLGLYLLALRRRRARLEQELAARPAERADPADSEAGIEPPPRWYHRRS